MAGEPTTPEPAVAPTPPPAPTPTPAPPEPNLTREQMVAIPDRDGKMVNVSLGDMADAHRDKPNQEALDQLALHQKVAAGDQEAIAQYLKTFTSTPTTPEPTTEATELQGLQERINQLEASLTSNVNPVISQITDNAINQQLVSLVQTHKEQFPLLEKFGARESAELVRNRLGYYEQMAKARNIDVNTLPDVQKQKLVMQCLTDAHNHIQGVGQRCFGAQTETVPAPPGTPIANDQTVPTSGQVGARYAVDSRGGITDTWAPAQPQGPEPIATTPVPVAPGGSPPGIQGTQPQPAGPMTPNSMTELMARRTAVLGGTA